MYSSGLPRPGTGHSKIPPPFQTPGATRPGVLQQVPPSNNNSMMLPPNKNMMLPPNKKITQSLQASKTTNGSPLPSAAAGCPPPFCHSSTKSLPTGISRTSLVDRAAQFGGSTKLVQARALPGRVATADAASLRTPAANNRITGGSRTLGRPASSLGIRPSGQTVSYSRPASAQGMQDENFSFLGPRPEERREISLEELKTPRMKGWFLGGIHFNVHD